MGIKIGSMRKAIYISWGFDRVEIDTTYGFNDCLSVVDYTFELPKELVKEYQILFNVTADRDDFYTEDESEYEEMMDELTMKYIN